MNRKCFLCILYITHAPTGVYASDSSWFSKYWQNIKSYVTSSSLGSAAVGSVAGALVAKRSDMNPCVGIACGLVMGGSLGLVKDYWRSYQSQAKDKQKAILQEENTQKESDGLPVQSAVLHQSPSTTGKLEQPGSVKINIFDSLVLGENKQGQLFKATFGSGPDAIVIMSSSQESDDLIIETLKHLLKISQTNDDKLRALVSYYFDIYEVLYGLQQGTSLLSSGDRKRKVFLIKLATKILDEMVKDSTYIQGQKVYKGIQDSVVYAVEYLDGFITKESFENAWKIKQDILKLLQDSSVAELRRAIPQPVDAAQVELYPLREVSELAKPGFAGNEEKYVQELLAKVTDENSKIRLLVSLYFTAYEHLYSIESASREALRLGSSYQDKLHYLRRLIDRVLRALSELNEAMAHQIEDGFPEYSMPKDAKKYAQQIQQARKFERGIYQQYS